MERSLEYQTLITWIFGAVLLNSLVPCHSASLPNIKTAFIVIDVQYCFIPGGTLPVPNGDKVVNMVNSIRAAHNFDMIVLSQDWHCSDHVSFASQHAGYAPFSLIDLEYDASGQLCRNENLTASYTANCSSVSHQLSQTLWPDHCVKNSADADLHANLTRLSTDKIIYKGDRCYVDSYSAFFDNGGFAQTQLHNILQAGGITNVFISGLALDFCVQFTAKDAKKLGYTTTVVQDATAQISAALAETAVTEMKALGINVINATDIRVLSSGATNHQMEGLTIATLMGTIFTFISSLNL